MIIQNALSTCVNMLATYKFVSATLAFMGFALSTDGHGLRNATAALNSKLSLAGKEIAREVIMSMQEVEKEITDEQPGKRPKKRIVTVMEYLYEQELEGDCHSLIKCQAA